MKIEKLFSGVSFPFAILIALASGSPALALTDAKIGPSGKTYASAAVKCALDPVAGMAPMVQAGLYNPSKTASAAVKLNGNAVTTVTFISPDATVWLPNSANTVTVSPDKKTTDSYSYDTSTSQINVCVPNTTNTVTGDLEYAAQSYATVTPGCALNPANGKRQLYVNLFDKTTAILNVTLNQVPLTQMSASRPKALIFLAPGWNVFTAANGLGTDTFVRKGVELDTCALP
ncbi:MAG: hypothetical protein ACR652_19530 [Methylocystis sp.]|uniref:hypothetical protein n=1 Tax=Methylocystis sp. TaxID=1911079 RepID=UPI003DA5703B